MDSQKYICNSLYDVRQGILVDKVHEINFFKQINWLENYIIFKTQQKNQATGDFEKDVYKSSNIAFYGKIKENV